MARIVFLLSISIVLTISRIVVKPLSYNQRTTCRYLGAQKKTNKLLMCRDPEKKLKHSDGISPEVWLVPELCPAIP